MFGFGKIGLLLLAVVANLPTSHGIYCYLCSPKTLGEKCGFIGVCQKFCIYFVKGQIQNHRQDWTCLELVPEQWKGVNLVNRWASQAELFILSHQYYPNEDSSVTNYVAAAYGCNDDDYCNIQWTEARGLDSQTGSAFALQLTSAFSLSLLLLGTLLLRYK